MLLPHSGWPLTSTVRIISLPAVTTHANEPKDLRDYWTKIRQMFSRGNFFIDGVDATIRVAIRPPVVEWDGRLRETIGRAAEQNVCTDTASASVAVSVHTFCSAARPIVYLSRSNPTPDYADSKVQLNVEWNWLHGTLVTQQRKRVTKTIQGGVKCSIGENNVKVSSNFSTNGLNPG